MPGAEPWLQPPGRHAGSTGGAAGAWANGLVNARGAGAASGRHHAVLPDAWPEYMLLSFLRWSASMLVSLSCSWATTGAESD